MLKHLTVWILFILTLLSAGCNTISGLGEDLETAGEEIEDTAEDAKN